MSLFSACIICNDLASNICKCSDPPQLFCKTHIIDHIDSEGKHQIWALLDALSSEEASCLGDTFEAYKHTCIREVLLKRNSIIDRYSEEIRKVEEECSFLIRNILNGPVTREVEEIVSRKSLPLFSQSAIVKSLLSFKQRQKLSEESILESLRLYFPSPRLTSNQLFSVPSSSSQMLPQLTNPVQTSSMPLLSLQTAISEKFIATDEPKWELFKLKSNAHDNEICSIAISDCEQYLASGSTDKTIKIWDFKTLDLVRTLRGHTDFVRSVAFLGNKVVSGSWDKTIKIWEEDQCTATLNVHSDVVICVCTSSCKKLIVSGSRDKTVAVYSLELNKTVRRLKGHTDYVISVAMSSNNEEIVSGSVDKSIKVWKTKTGELLKTLKGHSDYVFSVAFNGEFIISSSEDKTVRMWNRKTGEALLTLREHSSRVMGVEAIGNLIISIGADDKIIAWNARTRTIIQNLKGHGNYNLCYFMSLKCSEGAKFIVSGGMDKNIKLWKKIN